MPAGHETSEASGCTSRLCAWPLFGRADRVCCPSCCAWSRAGLVVVGPSPVGDWGFGVEPQAGLVGTGGQRLGGSGPAVPVGAGVVDERGSHRSAWSMR